MFEFEISIGGAGLTQKALFAKHLSVMLRAGLPITEALSISIDSTEGKFKKVLQHIMKSVQSGNSFSLSLADHPSVFSEFFISAVYAGESSGTLEENLENVAKELQKEKELASKIRGAMIYPVLILSATFILGLVLSFIVLPKITPLFQGLKINLPVSTRMLIWFSNIIQAHGILIMIIIAISVSALVWLVRQRFMKPITHWLFLHAPVLKNITRGSNLARFSRTLGSLLKSGVNIDKALDITKTTVSNYYYQAILNSVSRNVAQGGRLSENLGRYENFFPKLVTRMIRVGEESGKLEETLLYISEFYETEVDDSTKTLSTTIEPILLAFIGLVVAFLAMSIITPIYDITGSIKQ